MLNRKVLIRLIVIAGGMGIILLALFAFQLGLDNDPGWGPRRFQILGTGLAIVLFGGLYWITPALSRWFETSLKSGDAAFFIRKTSIQNEPGRLARPILDSKWIGRLKQKNWFAWIVRNQMNIWLVLVGCFVLWAYIWIITIGRIEKWPSGRDYYWMLTQAFQNGQTYLLVNPNPELLKLENPYDLQQRKGLEYLWDTTLYDGKYYLYWGPVPAVLGVLVNFITSKPVSDAGLVFSFIVGTALFSVFLLRKLYQDHNLPAWVFWGGALASVMNIPSVWLFTHPAYYEASIAGGQFFMMAGFLLLYVAFRSPSSRKEPLVFAALAFGLAGGTRISLLPSVVFLALMILWQIYTLHGRKFSSSRPALVAVLVPLAIIACSLAWYNYVRFGSIFEFGHRYQLTGLSLTENYGDQTSINYILPNFYTYVFRLPSLHGEFPFVTLPWIKENMWPSFINLPENYYYPEPVAGILFVIPLIGFTALLVIRWLWLLANGDVSIPSNKEITLNRPFFWLGVSMLGYVLIQTLILFVFISSSMRYLFDLSPALIVFSTMFVGYQVQEIETKPYIVKILSGFWLMSSVLTVVFGFFIGLTGSQNNFLNKNPQLYYQLLEWFNR